MLSAFTSSITRRIEAERSSPTCFVLGEGDDVLVIVVDEPREGAGQAHAHAHLVVVPVARVLVLLQTHQAPAEVHSTNVSRVMATYLMDAVSGKAQIHS